MDKIKKILSPGSNKDDEVMYGDVETRRKESVANTSDEPAKLYPTEGAAGQKDSGGVISQIMNPGGTKYDEQRYGTTATSNPDPEKLPTEPSAPKDHTVLGQILNPGGHKYDEQRFGETAAAAGTEQDSETRGIGNKLYPNNVEGENQAHYPGLGNSGAPGVVDPNTTLETDSKQKDHTVLRQILNPSGNKRDDVAFGTTAHVAEEKSVSDAGRSDHLGSSVGAVGASSTLADRTVASGDTSGNRETSVAGVTSGVGAPVIFAAAPSITPAYNEPQSHILDRSHPLRDGSGAATGHINPVGAPEATAVQQTSQTETTGMAPVSHINPVGAPSTASATLPVMASAAATGSLAASSQSQDHSTRGATSGGATYTDHSGATKISDLHPVGTKLDCDGKPVPGYVHHVDGPHSLDMANALDPRVAATPASSPMAIGSTTGSHSHSSTGVTSGAGGQYSEITHGKDGSTSHTSGDHEKKEKTGLLQKILHPRSHKEEKEGTHEPGHPSTTADNHGRKVLHKDPPSH